jgi:hypothetical protein
VEHLTRKVQLVTDTLEREKQLEIKQKSVIQQLEKDAAEVERMEAEYEKLIQSQATDEPMEEERVKHRLSFQTFKGYETISELKYVDGTVFDFGY